MTKVVIKAADGVGAVDLYHNANLKIETTADGVKILDNVKYVAGTGDDLQIYHNGSTSLIEDSVGDFRLRSDALKLQAAGGANYVHCTSGGAVQIYYDNAKKFETTSGGVSFNDTNITNVGSIALDQIKGDGDDDTNITFAGSDVITVKCGSTSPALTINTTQVKIEDNQKFVAGTGNDLEIYHTAASSCYIDNKAGSLFIRNSVDDQDVIIQSDDGSGGLAHYIQADGSNGEVRLYHYGNERFNTTSGGATITGDLTINDGTPKVSLIDTNDNDSEGAIQHTSGNLYLKADDNQVEGSSSIRFQVDNAEKARILTGGGITFNGDTAAANALDDYEEGEFTLSYSANFSGDASWTKGWYTKIGSEVTARFYVNCTAVSGSDVFMIDLPFTAAANSTNAVRRGLGPVMLHNANVPANVYDMVTYCAAGATYARWYMSVDNGAWTSLLNSHMLTSTDMHASITYSTL